jgi:hypothetical protein
MITTLIINCRKRPDFELFPVLFVYYLKIPYNHIIPVFSQGGSQMNRLLSNCLAVMFLFLNVSCTPADKNVVERVFPECFADPVIGASSGARCSYIERKQEWHITYWHGWGDCPAGCINKEETAWYIVDRKGKVYESDSSFNVKREVPGNEPLGKGRVTNKAQKITTKGLQKNGPKKNVGKKADDKKTIWVGRSLVVGQCEDVNAIDKANSNILAMPGKEPPEIIEKVYTPPIKPGRKFKKWVESYETETFERDKDGFMCEACYVCKDFRREYVRIYLKDLESYQNMGWMRLDN